jgi:hypothetical protein
MTERERALACGMTAEEAECWELTVSLARHWFALPNLHEADDHEVVHAIHVIQCSVDLPTANISNLPRVLSILAVLCW